MKDRRTVEAQEPGEERANSAPPPVAASAPLARKGVSLADARRILVARMLADGHIQQSCVDESGAAQAVDLRIVKLSPNGQQFEIGGGRCAFGARSPMLWIYEIQNDKATMLADLGATDGLGISRTRTNGYLDVELSAYYGGEVHTFVYKYDGQTYRQVR